MSVKKRKSKKEPPKSQTVKADIDYEKLAHAVANALIEADSMREKQREEDRKQAQERLNHVLRGKDCPTNAGKVKRLWYKVRNWVGSSWHLLWLKKKEAENIQAATALAQLALVVIFGGCQFLLYGMAISHIYRLFFSLTTFQVLPTVLHLLWSVASFLYAQLFRLARFEVDRLRDGEYVIALLSGVASFLAMLFTLISLFK